MPSIALPDLVGRVFVRLGMRWASRDVICESFGFCVGTFYRRQREGFICQIPARDVLQRCRWQILGQCKRLAYRVAKRPGSLSSISGERLVYLVVTRSLAQAKRGEQDPMVIHFPGGYAALADAIRCPPEQIRAMLRDGLNHALWSWVTLPTPAMRDQSGAASILRIRYADPYGEVSPF